MQEYFIDPQLAEDIAISRRELAEGKGIPHAQVMTEMDSLIDRVATHRARLPNAETIAALMEGDRIASDPTRKTYDNLDEFWSDMAK